MFTNRAPRFFLLAVFALVPFAAPCAPAQPSAESPGPMLLIGGRHQDLSKEMLDLFFTLAGGPKAKIVVIPTAAAHADETTSADEFLKPWLDRKPLSAQILHTRERKVANDPAFVKPLTEATAVFFTNGHRDRIFNAYRGTLVHKELKKLQARGGLIGGTGTGAAVQSDFLIEAPRALGLTEAGLGLLPGLMVDDRGEPEPFAKALAAHPEQVGLMIDAGAAVLIEGKTMRVIGAGAVTLRLAQGAGLDAKNERLKTGRQLDLVALRRAAALRAGKE